METSDERRTRRLKQLAQALPGGYAQIAAAAEISEAALKQIAKGVLLPAKQDGSRSRRALGSHTAERIAEALGLGRGWFDSAAPIPSQPIRKNEPTETWPFVHISPAQMKDMGPERVQIVENLALSLSTLRLANRADCDEKPDTGAGVGQRPQIPIKGKFRLPDDNGPSTKAKTNKERGRNGG